MTKTNGIANTVAQVMFLFALGTTAFADEPGSSSTATDFGQPGKAENVTRTINIVAQDMEFIPATLDVKANETVRFVVTNTGSSKHEFVIGEDTGGYAEAERTEAHEDAGETNEIELAVGETRELVWTFNSPREIEFACHQPGHYEAGMLGKIGVKP